MIWNSWLSGMKSFRDVLNGRMRTGKGRFVLASLFPGLNYSISSFTCSFPGLTCSFLRLIFFVLRLTCVTWKRTPPSQLLTWGSTSQSSTCQWSGTYSRWEAISSSLKKLKRTEETKKHFWGFLLRNNEKIRIAAEM